MSPVLWREVELRGQIEVTRVRAESPSIHRRGRPKLFEQRMAFG